MGAVVSRRAPVAAYAVVALICALVLAQGLGVSIIGSGRDILDTATQRVVGGPTIERLGTSAGAGSPAPVGSADSTAPDPAAGTASDAASAPSAASAPAGSGAARSGRPRSAAGSPAGGASGAGSGSTQVAAPDGRTLGAQQPAGTGAGSSVGVSIGLGGVSVDIGVDGGGNGGGNPSPTGPLDSGGYPGFRGPKAVKPTPATATAGSRGGRSVQADPPAQVDPSARGSEPAPAAPQSGKSTFSLFAAPTSLLLFALPVTESPDPAPQPEPVASAPAAPAPDLPEVTPEPVKPAAPSLRASTVPTAVSPSAEPSAKPSAKSSAKPSARSDSASDRRHRPAAGHHRHPVRDTDDQVDRGRRHETRDQGQRDTRGHETRDQGQRDTRGHETRHEGQRDTRRHGTGHDRRSGEHGDRDHRQTHRHSGPREHGPAAYATGLRGWWRHGDAHRGQGHGRR